MLGFQKLTALGPAPRVEARGWSTESQPSQCGLWCWIWSFCAKLCALKWVQQNIRSSRFRPLGLGSVAVPRKHTPSHVDYGAEFSNSASNCVGL